MVPVFLDICLVPVSQFSRKYIIPLLLWLCLLWLYKGFWLIYSSSLWKKSFLGFYFTFSQFPTIIFSIFFLKFVIYLVILEMPFLFNALTHKWWVYYRINGFKRTGMVQCNYSSLVILINDAKYIFTQLFNFLHPFHITSINHS